MNNFRDQLKLSDHLTTTLELTKAEFINAFNKNVDIGNIGLFSNAFEVFSSSPNRYKGTISENSFALKMKRRMFGSNMKMSRAYGVFRQENGKLIIETEIKGFNQFVKFFLGFFLLIYAGAISTFLLNTALHKEIYVLIALIIAHAVFMFSVFYLLICRSVRYMKYDLEREFFFWTKK